MGTSINTDVLTIRAGPAGLTLACTLKGYEIDFTVYSIS